MVVFDNFGQNRQWAVISNAFVVATTTAAPITSTTPTTLAPVTKPQLVPDPVPPPTTPSLIRVYELPTEDLFNVSYQSTANHYWVFTHGTPWITDLAPEANFLSEELFDRYSKYDQKLTTSPYKEDFDQSPPSLLKTLNSIDEFVGESQLAGGLFTEDTRSVWLGRDLSRPCFRLVADLAQERKYFRDCLLDPEACDYGLSASVWVYFNSLAASGRETLLSTAPQGEAGFSMFIKNEILTVELSGSQRSWVCSVTVSIETRSWNNIGFTWRSYTGDISVILNNEVLRTCTGSSSESINGLPKAPPTSLWLGCSSDGEFGDPETGVEDAYLTHPALWYWPLQLHVLFLGSKADRSNAPTGLPQDDSKPTDQKVDYTTLVEEYQPQNWSQLPANPYYVTADGFFEFTASPNTTRGQDVEYIPTNCRNRGSYKLNTSEAFYKVKDAVKDTCPTNFAKCQNGFSIGAWVMVPASLRPTNKYLTLFEVFGQVKIVLFGDFLHVFVSDGERWQVTRLVMEVVRDEFFNLGFSLSGEPTKLATGFINGLPQTTMAFAAQSMESTEVHEGVVSGDILIGSGAVGNTTSGVVISDLVYWTRITLAEEGHRFIGYTPAQLRLLSQSDRYWSVDAYLLHDAPCHAAYEKKRYGETDADSPTPNFKLVSVYKPRGVQPVRFIPDQNEQSPTPILSMRKTDYFMLGRAKKELPSQEDLQWHHHCLHDTMDKSCGEKGVTFSIWLSLQSTGGSRHRYIFNSGDAGSSDIPAVMDGHGWAIFTLGDLVGVTISEGNRDWEIMLDSKTYKIDQWLNLGVTWSVSDGMRILINGVDINLPSSKPKTRYKGYIPPPYLVVGRFNTDDSSTWLSPAEAEAASNKPTASNLPIFWEMAHLAFSEIAHFNHYMTPREYAQMFGFLGNSPIGGDSLRLWHGLGLLDPTIHDLLLASRLDIPFQFGALTLRNASSFSVQYDSSVEAVVLGNETALRFGPLDPRECPGNLSKCTEGFTIGGWYALKAVIEGMSHGNFTGPVILVSGNGGEVGIALVDGGHAIVGWVGGLACQGSTGDWTRMERQNQWFHVAVSWYPNDEIGLFLNSVRISSCGELEKYETVNSTIAEARNIFTETATNSAYLIAKSPPLVEVGYRLAVAIVNVFDNFINPCQTPESFMGLTHAQMNHFAESSFYWPMSGLLTNLAPERLKTSSVVKARDRQHVEGAALCTDGTSKSYMILSGDGEAMSNLLNSCLYSSTKCEKLMFMIDFRFNAQLPREDKEFALVRAQASDDSVGILITVHPLNELITVVFRTPYTKCINSGNLSALEQNNEAWSYLQVYVTSGEAPMLSVNEKILAPRSQGTCHIENSSAPLSRPNITIGREVAICVSDVSIVENLNTVNPMAEVCYLETDTLLQLRGEQANHRGVPDSAFDLSSFTNRVSSKQIATCFGNSMTKCPEFTLSFWLKLNGGGTVAPSNTDHMVVSSGPGTYQGFSVSVQIVARSATFNLIVVLIMPDSIYRVFVAEFGVIGTWYNIGLVVGGTGTPAGTSVEVYRNGHAYVMTSLPVMQDPFKQFPVNPSPGLYFGSAITKMTNMSSVAIAPGVVSMFAFWMKRVASCASPQSSHKILLGKCVLNETLPTTVACQEAHYCRLSRDGVCLDATVANIYTMAKGVQLISSPDALLSLLQIVVNFLQNTSTHDDAETLRKLLWSSTTLLSHLTIVKDEPEFSKAYLRMEAFAIVGFILEFIESIFDIRFVEAWSFVNEVDPLEPNGVGTMLTVLLPELVTPNQPIIEVRRGGSFIGSYLLPANSTLWNHTYLFNSQLKIIIPSMTESSPPDSEVCVFTIATLRARYFDVEMEAMSLPKVVKWTGPSTDVWALINSPLVVTSLEENARGVLPYETKYEFTVELLQPNEYADSAFARRTDSMHWKAMAVEAKGRGELEYRVKCVLWEDARPPIAASAGQWATEECEVVQANLTHVVCSCETTGTFAVAMDYIDVVETARSFWKMAGANSWKLYDTLKLALNFSGNSLSLISLLGLTACLWFKETIVDLRDQRTIKFHLIMMLAGYQICFLLYPLVEKNEFGCRATGMLMHFFVTTFLAWNTLNNFYVFGALINGILRARLKLFVCFVWLANGVVVFAMAWATEMRDYGKRIMCLPDGATGHVMLTGVTFYLLITLIACFVLLCNTDTPAYLKPAVIEALQGELYATVNITHYCVLVYSLGFAFTHLNPPYVGFIFWTANSLLGCLVTLCFGPLGKRIAVKKRRSSDIFESGKDLATSVEAQKDAEGRPPSSASFDNFGLAEDEEVVSVEFADKSD